MVLSMMLALSSAVLVAKAGVATTGLQPDAARIPANLSEKYPLLDVSIVVMQTNQLFLLPCSQRMVTS